MAAFLVAVRFLKGFSPSTGCYTGVSRSYERAFPLDATIGLYPATLWWSWGGACEGGAPVIILMREVPQ